MVYSSVNINLIIPNSLTHKYVCTFDVKYERKRVMRDNKREGQRLLLCGVLCVLLGLALCFATACSAQPSKGDVTGESELVSGQIPDDESINSSPTDGEKSPTLILRDGIVDLEKRTVEVKVEIENNPGISALQFSVHYGDELTLQRVEFDDRFGAYVTAPIPYENPQMITFMNPLKTSNENGLFATLVFQITQEARPNTAVHLHANIVEENTLDGDLEPISFSIANGIVQIP